MNAGASLPPLDALDAWLAAREASVDDLKADNEACVRWFAEPGERSAISIVYLHGFSASRREVSPLCERVADALGANVYFARLDGHGSTGAALAAASSQRWVDEAREALAIGRALGDRVVLVGCSTGATLATLVAPDAADLAAVVLIAPNFGVRDPRSALLRWPLARRWVPLLVGERDVPPENAGHAAFWTTSYPVAALFPMSETVAAVAGAPLERIRAPVLTCWCEDDAVIDPACIEPTLARMTGAELEREVVAAMPASDNHVIAGDVFAPAQTDAMIERVLRFLRDRVATEPSSLA